MAGSIVGTAVRRVEDPELLTGRGTFVDDVALVGALHLAFVRSPMAHARVLGVDTAGASAVDGVVCGPGCSATPARTPASAASSR